MPAIAQPCPVCDYDLADTPPEAPCPECGTPSINRTDAARFRRIDRRRNFRVFATLMIPAWFFLATHISGYITAFWILGIPRGRFIHHGQHASLDVLYWCNMFGMVILPASGVGLLISPFYLVPAIRRFHADDNARRLTRLLILALPALALAALMILEPAPATLFTWVPD